MKSLFAYDIRIIAATLIGIIALSGCGRSDDKDAVSGRTIEDLEKAISVIRDRRETEMEIIKQEKYAISLLETNIKKAHSDGMREKIRDEIIFKRAVITKAEKNKANQDRILEKLLFKRDSIKGIRGEGLQP